MSEEDQPPAMWLTICRPLIACPLLCSLSGPFRHFISEVSRGV
jgi:hypothetical protein